MLPIEHRRWCDRGRCNDLAHLGRMIEVRSISDDYGDIRFWLRQTKVSTAEAHIVLVDGGESVIVMSLRQAKALGYSMAQQARLAD